MKRMKLKKRANKKNFRKGTKVKAANATRRPMRGGWRL